MGVCVCLCGLVCVPGGHYSYSFFLQVGERSIGVTKIYRDKGWIYFPAIEKMILCQTRSRKVMNDPMPAPPDPSKFWTLLDIIYFKSCEGEGMGEVHVIVVRLLR